MLRRGRYCHSKLLAGLAIVSVSPVLSIRAVCPHKRRRREVETLQASRTYSTKWYGAPVVSKYAALNRACRAKSCAPRGHAHELSVRLSVRLSVTLRYHGHIGWNFWKIISQLISLTFPLSAHPNITDVLLQSEHPQILAGIGVGYRCKIESN